MANKSDDEEELSRVRPDDATKIIRAKAERLDVRGTAAAPAKINEAPPETEVVALRKRVQRQRTALLTAGSLLVIMLIVLFVVIATPAGRSEGSGSTSTAATTTTTTSSSTPRAEPTTTTNTTTTTTESATTPVSSTPVAPSEIPPPRTVSAPPVHLNGQDYLLSGSSYDFDRGTTYGDGDIVHDGKAVSGSEGALLALGKPGSDEYSRCDPAMLENSWRSHIPFSEVPVGSVLCVWTTEGRVSYLEITGAPSSNGGDYLRFRWTTWQK